MFKFRILVLISFTENLPKRRSKRSLTIEEEEDEDGNRNYRINIETFCAGVVCKDGKI